MLQKPATQCTQCGAESATVSMLLKALAPFAERYRRGSREVEDANAYRACDIPFRGTGRSTRQLEEALAIAVTGKRVLFVCVNHVQAIEIQRGLPGSVLHFCVPRRAGDFLRSRIDVIVIDHAARIEDDYVWERFDAQSAALGAPRKEHPFL